mgnify:CR=1 FL=1
MTNSLSDKLALEYMNKVYRDFISDFSEEVLPPVSRSELLEYYLEADIMFLHLNNIAAFQRVLPIT